MDLLNDFTSYLHQQTKSEITVKGYKQDMKQYFQWFHNSYGKECPALYRENVLEYISFLKNVKMQNAKTINRKISSLSKFNAFLIETNKQDEFVVDKSDMLKVQTSYASPTKVTETEVKQFLQNVLESSNKRNYAIVVLIAYTGLRISEALAVKLDDFNLQTGECIIRNGKGEKQRIVLFNSKVILSLREYLKVRDKYTNSEHSPYLFLSKKRVRLDRTVVNRIFKNFSDSVTPHQLRHFFCSNGIEKGLSIHEVANQAGHSNVHTTLLYTNPDQAKLKSKMELL
ncbi:tyrosine-type recombinase/integrase [Halobacillus shinanisalinarum]|uniref:Tyrosine-type recombinase/integrase n=1 Tax=Halobacillus shinanisalinarum TaxID=2932258 RepID=A0ABY4GZ78_9BACI|nr:MULTISPECIES: tyrosine-type recombinase/integrase [Halobacillus]UOQ93331.1 tyrosine-type recombinase/integrase [Halobacillus shinanisalinarum]